MLPNRYLLPCFSPRTSVKKAKKHIIPKRNPNIILYFFDNLKSIVDFPFDIEISAKVFVSDLM